MYKVNNTKIKERIKQSEIFDRIAEKSYIEYLKDENKRLKEENKHLKELIEICKNMLEFDYGI